jgi:two-component system, LytTR family, sensor kinase
MAIRNFIIRYKLYHLVFWLVVFALWYYLRYQDYSTMQKALTVTLIKVLDLALLIYSCNYILVPKLLYKKRYGWFATAFILMIAMSSVGKMLIIGHVINNPALMNLSGNWKGRIYDNVIPHFFLVTAGVAFKLLFDYTRLQKRLAEVAKEKAEAELNFLKSQINPHFLFNSLNSVYFLIDKENEEARKALHKFSDMLRYQLYECNGERIPVEKEIGYLKDYVDLQQLRLNENTVVQFSCMKDVNSFTIEPLLLIPFVENSFKHVSHYSNGKQNFIQINIGRENGAFRFSVYNTTEEKQAESLQQGGIGLQNVKKRLELLYPGQYSLQLHKKNDWFGVELNLSIK